jgi:hypothetical protein
MTDQNYDYHGIAADVFSQRSTGRLCDFSEMIWNFHRDRIDATFEGGWDNATFPWDRNMHGWWKYPLAFATYSIPSVIMVEPTRYAEAASCLKKSILLFKDTPLWEDWVKYGHGPDPICCRNIMYKAHLHVMYGLYQLITGSTEFEPEYNQLTDIIIRELIENRQNEGFDGIVCEDDQYFPVCNSQIVIGMTVHDMVFGTKYYDEYGKRVSDFIATKISDPATKMILYKYHPSHDQAEAYLSGACNTWGLTQLHYTNPTDMQTGYENFKRLLVARQMDGALYLKECVHASDPAMGLEESFGLLYALGLAREYQDPDLWAGFMKYLGQTSGLAYVDGRVRLVKATNGEEHHANSYILWGALHESWDQVFQYDWASLRDEQGARLS